MKPRARVCPAPAFEECSDHVARLAVRTDVFDALDASEPRSCKRFDDYEVALGAAADDRDPPFGLGWHGFASSGVEVGPGKQYFAVGREELVAIQALNGYKIACLRLAGRNVDHGGLSG